jgi:hypothetical protein
MWSWNLYIWNFKQVFYVEREANLFIFLNHHVRGSHICRSAKFKNQNNNIITKNKYACRYSTGFLCIKTNEDFNFARIWSEPLSPKLRKGQKSSQPFCHFLLFHRVARWRTIRQISYTKSRQLRHYFATNWWNNADCSLDSYVNIIIQQLSNTPYIGPYTYMYIGTYVPWLQKITF